MMLKEMVTLFLDSRKLGMGTKKCSPATLHVYAWDLGVFLQFLVENGGVLRYEDLKRLHIVQFLNFLDGKEKSKEWSRPTVLQILRTLRTFFRWVEADEDLQEAGLKGHQKWLPKIEKNPRRIDIPKNPDLKKFKNSFKTDSRRGFRDYVATCLLMTNGMRLGELCNLKIDDMMLDDKVLLVEGKTGKRLVPITDDMVKLLKAWMKRRQEFPTAEGSPYVFVSKYDPKMTTNGFGQVFRKHRRKLELPRITAHTFRHAFSTHYLKQGGDIEKLRNITGHTTYEMLKDYLHIAKLAGKSLQEELEKVSLSKDL